MKELVKIKNSLDLLIENAYLKGDKEQTKNIFEELKQNSDLQLLYYCINNIQNPPKLSENEISEFIDENIKLAKTINVDNFTDLSEKLDSIELSDFDKNIDKVLFETKTAFNFSEYSKAKSQLCESIKEKSRPIELNLSDFAEEDVNFVKNLLQNPETVFNGLCKECLDVLDQRLIDADLNTKILIHETKEKILKSQIKFEFSPENVIEILNLKQDLLTN